MLVNFEICHFMTIPGLFNYFSEKTFLENQSFLNEGVLITLIFSLVLGV